MDRSLISTTMCSSSYLLSFIRLNISSNLLVKQIDVNPVTLRVARGTRKNFAAQALGWIMDLSVPLMSSHCFNEIMFCFYFTGDWQIILCSGYYFADVEKFLLDLPQDSLHASHEKRRDLLLENVIDLKIKLAQQQTFHVTNGIRSPRPKRKSYPCTAVKDSMHSYTAHLQKVSSEAKPKPPGSPEVRRADKPRIRPRSVSCPEIRFTASNTWKTSLPKVPENEELKEEKAEES